MELISGIGSGQKGATKALVARVAFVTLVLSFILNFINKIMKWSRKVKKCVIGTSK